MEHQRSKLPATNLENSLELIDPVQARRYTQLPRKALEIARDELARYLRVCDRLEIDGKGDVIREIIDDALTGCRVFTCGGGPF